MKRTSLAALIGLSLTAASASAATLTSGHVDAIGLGYEGGELDPHSHVEGGVVDGVFLDDQEYALGELIIQISATTTRAAGTEWNPIGVASGESYFIAPEVQVGGQPFVGVGLEELVASEWTGPISITLTAASGSGITNGGKFSLWQDDIVPTFFMSTLGGIDASDVISVPAGDHVHYNWGFTKEGTYDLEFEISGTHVDDGVKTATATYSFSVIPEPSAALLGAIGALGLLRRRR